MTLELTDQRCFHVQDFFCAAGVRLAMADREIQRNGCGLYVLRKHCG